MITLIHQGTTPNNLKLKDKYVVQHRLITVLVWVLCNKRYSKVQNHLTNIYLDPSSEFILKDVMLRGSGFDDRNQLIELHIILPC